jgi:hypothetical protein
MISDDVELDPDIGGATGGSRGALSNILSLYRLLIDS